MVTQFLKKQIHGFLRFLKLQLFISLVAMPILLWWGLPISILSPLGNLIFAPFLALFLMLSSLVFFLELFYVPNKAVVWCLEVLTKFWLSLMHIDGHPWLFNIAKPSLFFSCCILFMAFLILHVKKCNRISLSILCFALLIGSSCLYIKNMYAKTDTISRITCNKSALTIVHAQHKSIVIDPGVIGQRINAKSWIEYTLVPELIKSGATCIDSFIVLQPGSMTFQAIGVLVTKIKVQKVYLVCWKGTMTKHEWREFFVMKRTLESQQVEFKRINNHEIKISFSPISQLAIKPLEQIIKQKDITFPAIRVTGNLGDKTFELESYKFSKKNKDTDEKESSISNSK